MTGDASGAQRRSGDPGLAIGLVLALLATLPVVLARYPQMADYPAHLARWHVMLDGARSPDLLRYYVFEWRWMPNLGADLLIRPLAALLGLEPGGRVLAGLIPVLLGLSFVAVDRALHGRVGVGSLLAMTTIWAPTLLMGFVNFSLAEALAFLAFALWVRLAEWRWRAAVFVVIAPVVWLCHLAGWGVLGVLVLGFEWAGRRGLRGLVGAALATWPLWPPLALTLLAGTGAQAPFDFSLAAMQGKAFYWVIGLRDSVMPLDLASEALLGAVPVWALRSGRADPRIGIAALIFAALVFLVPRNLGGGDYADYRLVPVALAAGALSADFRPSPRWLLVAALPFLLRIGVTSAQWIEQSAETGDALKALDHVPRGSVVAAAWGFEPGRWSASPQGHVFAYATVRRDALTNVHFAIPGVHMLRLKDADPAFIDPSQRIVLMPGERPDLAGFGPAARAQFLWYLGDAEPLRLPAGAQVIWRGRHATLARLAKASEDR